MTVSVVLADDHPVHSDGLAQAIAVIRAHRPDVAVLEVTVPGLAGLEAGAIAEAVRDAIAAVAAGTRTRREACEVLSGRERRVLQLTADGMSSSVVGETLHLSRATVKAQLRGIYRKLGVSERAAAVAVGMRSGLLE